MFDSETEPEIARAAADPELLNQLFQTHRPRLKRMVQFRMNRRLQGRIGGSDIVQDALVDAAKKFKQYADDPQIPFYLWLRHLTALKLAGIHRRHLDTQTRDARQEVPLDEECLPEVDSAVLAAGLIGKVTSAYLAAIAAERSDALQKILDEMSSFDRELITLKHFEQFTIAEVSQLLHMPKATVGRYYLNAMKKLRYILKELPEFDES